VKKKTVYYQKATDSFGLTRKNQLEQHLKACMSIQFRLVISGHHHALANNEGLCRRMSKYCGFFVVTRLQQPRNKLSRHEVAAKRKTQQLWRQPFFTQISIIRY
jgi:hypothetical protein